MSKMVNFQGILSGDYEAFCWDVTKETFIYLKNSEPDIDDQSCFNENLYKIYPDDIFGNSDKKIKINFKIEFEKVGDQ
jgi:hypothetical protein